MELKYKTQKIRDMFIYYTGIVPVSIDIKRHELVITVRGSDLDRRLLTESDAIDIMSQVTGRKITLNQTNEEG